MPSKSPDTRLTIRFTPEERQALEVGAGDQALSTYVRELVLERSVERRKKRKTAPLKDHRALAQVLALLGGHKLVVEFRKVERDVANGVVHGDDEVMAALDECRLLLRQIHALLMRAIGVSER